MASSAARQRQHHALPTTPAIDVQASLQHSDIKDTQHVTSSGYDLNNVYGSYRSNLTSSNGNGTAALLHSQTPVSSFLSRSLTQARKSLSGPAVKANLDNIAERNDQSLLSSIRQSVPFISLCSTWYMSSAMSSNTGKSILTRFRYPVTLTFVQFAFVAAYCVLVLAAREQFATRASSTVSHLSTRRGSLPIRGIGVRKPSRAMFQGTLMMSLFQIAGHVFSSMAIARVPVSTVHTIKALSPLFTVIAYVALFRVSYSSATYFALLPLTLGVMLACSFDLRANAIGFLCALGSTLVFVSQNIFSKKLLPKESSSGASISTSSANSGKLDKLNLLFYSSGMAFVLMIPIWLYSDGRTLLFKPTPTALANAPAGTTTSLVMYFFLNGTVHFAQNLLAFSILARTSPVTYSIASLVKRIAVICMAILWSGQTVTLLQGSGMTMTFAGLWLYNRAKTDVDKGERKRGQIEKSQQMFLPTSVEDARDLDEAEQSAPGLGISPNTFVGAGASGNAGALAGFLSQSHSSTATMSQNLMLQNQSHHAPHALYQGVQPAISPSRSLQSRHESPPSTARNRPLQSSTNDNMLPRRSWEISSGPSSALSQSPLPAIQSSVRYL